MILLNNTEQKLAIHILEKFKQEVLSKYIYNYN